MGAADNYFAEEEERYRAMVAAMPRRRRIVRQMIRLVLFALIAVFTIALARPEIIAALWNW